MNAFRRFANNPHSRIGFTIVELLVVIVVIAILATISFVAYNGIQQQARVSIAKGDLRTLGTAVSMYQAETGHYPSTRPELLDALGREPGALQLGVTNTGSFSSDKPKSFMYCFNDDGSSIWIVGWKPVVEQGGSASVPTGTPIYYWSNGSLQETGYEFDGEQAGSSLCKVASDHAYTSSVWSYSSAILHP